jgi:choline dehydrogenase-like flavoprotein
MSRVLPKGASVHYSGTLPMTGTAQDSFTCDTLGRLRGMANVIIADGAAFPALPAKNLTFTLMANATRLATLLS